MTTAVTPNAKSHAGLADMASRFVNVHEMPWEETRYPGVKAKTLLLDKTSGLVTVLLKMDPGAHLPDHEHVLIEQTFVIEGALVCEEGVCSAGNFVWRPAGSRHEAGTPNGGLMLAMFQVPNKFFEANGKITDMLNQDWNEAWGRASSLAQLEDA
jgi:anti-sigma factor ChrR (cupin superfamily)